ncbi:MAG: hypothetical protein AAGC99_10755 [Pseudomonadota bacterium]
MKTSLTAVTMVAALTISGCSVDRKPTAETASEHALARHIEIEVEDLERGLPCRVVDRRAPDARDILWRAEFQADFCRQKAEETRIVLQSRGWACRPTSAYERQDLSTKTDPRRSSPPYVVAAWRCLEGLRPTRQLASIRPHVPAARPDAPQKPETSPDDKDALQVAVARDLSVIGQDEIDDETTLDKALGDLNGDGREDAVVILTRETLGGAPHRMLMAYLSGRGGYNLVDVWILKASGNPDADNIELAIRDGRVHLGDCCTDRPGPKVLVLNDRKLAYADEG